MVRVYFEYASHLVLKVQNHSQALFCPKLRKFSANPLVKFYYDLANLDSASKIGCQHPPPPPPSTHLWKCEFGILAVLDSASKVGCHPPAPHLPTCENVNLGFYHFCTQHQKLATNPPPSPNTHPPVKMCIWDFSIFGLSIKSITYYKGATQYHQINQPH